MIDPKTLAVGDRVAAFHPGRLGVVNEGTVKTVGRKYVHVDFGELLGGTWKVPFADVLHLADRL